jgi:Fe(II)/alpha-ketoglutarate-dependent arginine beta-hydroxylase
METLNLSAEEIHSIRSLLEEVVRDTASVESPGFSPRAQVLAHELPRRVRSGLLDFKAKEPGAGIFLVAGLPVEDSRYGPTPPHWKRQEEQSPTLMEEAFLFLCGSLLGDCIGWSTQQEGRLVHDILPIRVHEDDQLGFGSKQTLLWHTEDAFHPLRGDYLGLLCLRNPDLVATTVASLEGIELSPEQVKLLFEPWYTIRPDDSHRLKNRPASEGGKEAVDSAYSQIERMDTQPERVAVLSGDPGAPYVRIDPYFMDPVPDNPAAQEALETLIHALENKLEEIVLHPGDVCFLDNFKVVHGRRPFLARYDGKDRWLKRVNITRDLRKSRAARPHSESRVIY